MSVQSTRQSLADLHSSNKTRVKGPAAFCVTGQPLCMLQVIGDHVRACVYLISDGVFPSNIGRGYILRRLIRRSILKVSFVNPYLCSPSCLGCQYIYYCDV